MNFRANAKKATIASGYRVDSSEKRGRIRQTIADFDYTGQVSENEIELLVHVECYRDMFCRRVVEKLDRKLDYPFSFIIIQHRCLGRQHLLHLSGNQLSPVEQKGNLPQKLKQASITSST